jgi:hypothetical protein
MNPLTAEFSRVLRGGRDIASGAMRYVRDTPLEEMASDAGDAAVGVANYARENPVEFGLGFVPVVGQALAVRDAARARQHGTDAEYTAALIGALSPLRAARGKAGAGVAAGPWRRKGAAGGAPEGGAQVPFELERTSPIDPVGGRLGSVEQARLKLREQADAYSQEKFGRPYAPVTERPKDYARFTHFPDASLEKQFPVAVAYEAAVRDSPTYQRAIYDAYGRTAPDLLEGTGSYKDLVAKAYEELSRETGEQFERLPVNNLRYHMGEHEYPSSAAMTEDVARGNLSVFGGGEEHPGLNAIDPVTGLNANQKFRAVHDVQHATGGTTFGPKGEERAFAEHSALFSPAAQKALATETRGQNSLVNFSGLNLDLHMAQMDLREQLKAALDAGDRGTADALQKQLRELGGQTVFAPQRTLLLPPEMTDPMYRGAMPDYLRSVLQSEGLPDEVPFDLFHYSTQQALRQTDPKRYGTGKRGAESRRLDADVRDRTYFYLNPDFQEPGVGPYGPFKTRQKLYDASKDTQRFNVLALREARREGRGITDADKTQVERMIKQRGYRGAAYPEAFGGAGAAIGFDPFDVE